MRAPAFWWRRTGWQALLLSPAAALYGAIAAGRLRGEGQRPPMPVICVGNFVAGGAGKTPTAIALAEIARSGGLAPVFVTRGYGGFIPGPVWVDPSWQTPGHVGDEAMLLAAVAPTVVSRKRPAAFPLLKASGADLCIMDDGFQNPSVLKTLSLVVVDAAVGVGNGWSLPAGPLRAPLTAQMQRANAIVLIGEGSGAGPIVRAASRAAKPILRARLVPKNPEDVAGRRVLAFSGIGRPEKFHESLRRAGAEVVDHVAFPDHHPFSTEDARLVLKRALAADLLPVTTEKDYVRLASGSIDARFELQRLATVFGIRCVFENSGHILSLLKEAREDWRRKAGLA